MTETQLDNQLVRQKDRLIELIDNGKTEQAQIILQFVREMWEAANYGYKFAELQARLKFQREAEQSQKEKATKRTGNSQTSKPCHT